MAEYERARPISLTEQLRRELVGLDATAVVDVVYGRVERIFAPKLDGATLTALLERYPDLVPADTLATTVKETVAGSADALQIS